MAQHRDGLPTKRRWPVVAGLVLILGGAVPAAHAAIDMSGPWTLFFEVGPVAQAATFVQTGGTLTVTLLGDTFTGFIDASGAFNLSDNLGCDPRLASGPTSFVGTASADGLTFSGYFVLFRGLACDVAEPIGVTGTRACTDDSPCDACSACDHVLGACVPSPATSCRLPAPGSGQLTVEMAGLRLGWRWRKGPATPLADFGDPVHTDTYALCVYDESQATPRTLLRATVPPGPSWQAMGATGFTYRDNLGSAGGVTRIGLRTGVAGRAKIRVAMTGSHPTLPFPTLPLALPVAVQLRGHGECWGAAYVTAGIKRNTARKFRANSSPSGAFLDTPEAF